MLWYYNYNIFKCEVHPRTSYAVQTALEPGDPLCQGSCTGETYWTASAFQLKAKVVFGNLSFFC